MTCKRAILGLCGVAVLLALPLLHGCSPSTELSGTPVPNAFPDTRLTGSPPSLRSTGFQVRFWWTGSDPDGRVRGYQWKLSDNGTDGISLEDTLTVSPTTGETLHPWRYTTVTDTIFIVTADEVGFPDDSALPERDRRSYQTHTLFVRAIDDNGAVDPSPAMVSFTSTTLVPSVIVDVPASLSGYTTSQKAPPTVTFGWTGADSDFELRVPVRVRYLWKRARYSNGYIDSRYVFDQQVNTVLSFSDSAWSDWIPYASRPEDRTVTFPNQARTDARGQRIHYLFAAQTQDTAGAVSVDRTYARNVHNVYIVDNLTPSLTVNETYLGRTSGVSVFTGADYDVAQNQPMDFSWAASASGYAGTVTAYRYGWDVADPTDENDAGWSILPGNTPQHLRAPRRAFLSGQHSLTVQCWDNSNQITRIVIRLSVVPVPARPDQFPLLFVDDVRDRISNGWPDIGGSPQDNDLVRDAFWEDVLASAGGVAGWEPSVNSFDYEDNTLFGYREFVQYRNVLIAHKNTVGSFLQGNFDSSVRERYVWLTTYQQLVGNVFLCGQSALQSFIGDVGMANARSADGREATPANWLSPIIFSTTEEYISAGALRYAAGFGWRQLPDGTLVQKGPESYPSLIWGIDVIDQPSHNYALYPGGPGSTGQSLRKASCVGLKALLLDPAFKSAYVDPGALADTIYTSEVVDWRDYGEYSETPTEFPALSAPFAWGLDEFYDRKLTNRPTSPQFQKMPDGRNAVEPMWLLLSRFDWIQKLHREYGDNGWPKFRRDGTTPNYTVATLESRCGKMALDLTGWSTNRCTAWTQGAAVGIISHKTELTKPGGNVDVLWGFDPSRFERAKIKKAIRWVLHEKLDLDMTNP